MENVNTILRNIYEWEPGRDIYVVYERDGEKREIKTMLLERGFFDLGLFLGIKGFENPIILSQSVVDISDKIFVVLVQGIIECVAARIATELFIGSADYSFAAFFALSSHGLS